MTPLQPDAVPGPGLEADARASFDALGLDLHPHPDRVSESYAEERIREKIASFGNERGRAGLANVNDGLKEAGIPPAYRLHLITAVVHLGRVSADSLPARVRRTSESLPP